MAVLFLRHGSAALFRADAYDQRSRPPVLFNPNGGVKLTLTDPNGVDVVSESAMSLDTDPGMYALQVQTTSNEDDWPLGPYTVTLKTQDGLTIVEEGPLEALYLHDGHLA
jgi:hypothetical protein